MTPPKAGTERSIAKDSATDSSGQVGIALVSLVTGIVLARTLGAEGRGQYVFATAFTSQALLALANAGLELSGRVMAAKSPARVAELHTLALAGAATVGTAIASIVFFFREAIERHVFPGIATTDLTLASIAIGFSVYLYAGYGLLIGLGEVRRRAFFDFVINAAQNILVLLILASFLFQFTAEEPLRALVISYYATIMASACALFVMLRRKTGALRAPQGDLARDYYTFGFWVWIGNGGSFLSQRMDEYIVKGLGRSDFLYGVYSLAASLAGRTRILPEALVRSAYSRVCSAESPEAARLVAACFRQMAAMGLLIVLVGAAVAPLLPLIYGADFAAASIPFVIFLAGRMFHNASRMLSMYFSGHLARPQVATAVNWTLLPLQAVLAWYAMKHFGIIGVAASTSAMFAATMLVFLALFLRAQSTVRLRELLRIGMADFAPWKRFFAGLLRKAARSKD